MLLLGFAACGADPQAGTPARHVVLITVDTLRADRLGAYGYAAARTPHFDALAARSVRFERAYAHASATLPSTASLMTGVLPGVHTLFSNHGKLAQELRTLSQRLHDVGFATGAFIGNFALRPSRGLYRGFDTYTETFEAAEAIRGHPENLAGPLTDQALAWIRDRDPERRVFLWVHYQEPHGPYTPPEFVAPPPEPAGPELRKNRKNTGIGGIPHYQWLGHGRLAEYRARYDGEIAETDRQLGRLLEGLEGEGILADATLVFTSDHGEAFGEENLYCAHGHGLLEVLLRVPLLLSVPGVEPRVRTDRVRLIDVAPTLLELAGLEDAALPGRSLLEEVGDREVVAQIGRERHRHWRSIRTGDFELRERGSGQTRLLAPPGQEPPAQLREQMHSMLEAHAPWPAPKREPELSVEERASLKALGYLD